MIPILVVAYVLISVLIIARRAYLDRIAQPQFPSLNHVKVIYQERWASGCSKSTWFTRIGGAQNCLRVVVTQDELWIRPQLFLSLFAAQLDLCHRIRHSTIVDARLNGDDALELAYTTDDGSECRFMLILQHTDKFMDALQSVLGTSNAEPGDAREGPHRDF